ncbi:MAG: SulP family inorganic anion transporter [Akkermansiaceae bacterium]
MFNLFTKKNGNYKDDILSGMTVALLLVPEAIAFSFIAGVNPMVGLWSGVFVGLITAIFGGRPGMICGATGAIALVAAQAFKIGKEKGAEGLAAGGFEGYTAYDIGMQYLVAALLFAGLIQILFGIFKLGRLVRLIPHPVMMGFVNGLAIMIAMGQGLFFQQKNGVTEGSVDLGWLGGSQVALMIALVILTMAIIQFLPRLTKAVPATLIAIITVFGIGLLLPGGIRDISDILRMLSPTDTANINSDFPPFSDLSQVPWMQADFYKLILPISLTIAMVGLLESLLTLQLIDDITETRGQGNRECIAQGTANIASGMFGGMGGCATIGQSLINMKNGGRGRTSGVVGALTLLALILFGADILMSIPVAALVGVMFMIVISTFEWATLRSINKIPHSELLVVIVVTAITVYTHNLAIGVGIGVILSALVFAAKSSTHIQVDTVKDSESEDERIYAPEGILYFGSASDFLERFAATSDRKNIVIDCEKMRVADLSGIEALNSIAEKYSKAGKNLKLRHLSSDCRAMLDKAGTMVTIEVLPDDPEYSVARLKANA